MESEAKFLTSRAILQNWRFGFYLDNGMNPIVPVRHGTDAGSRVVRQTSFSACSHIAAYNILVLRGDITIDPSKSFIMDDEMERAIQEHLKNLRILLMRYEGLS